MCTIHGSSALVGWGHRGRLALVLLKDAFDRCPYGRVMEELEVRESAEPTAVLHREGNVAGSAVVAVGAGWLHEQVANDCSDRAVGVSGQRRADGVVVRRIQEGKVTAVVAEAVVGVAPDPILVAHVAEAQILDAVA